MAFAAFIAGVWAAGAMGKMTDSDDPSEVVIDEVAGMWIALLGAPISGPHLLSAFLLFRLFDIWKPGPSDRLQNLPGGWGIMADDVAAGAVAGLLVALLVALPDLIQ